MSQGVRSESLFWIVIYHIMMGSLSSSTLGCGVLRGKGGRWQQKACLLWLFNIVRLLGLVFCPWFIQLRTGWTYEHRSVHAKSEIFSRASIFMSKADFRLSHIKRVRWTNGHTLHYTKTCRAASWQLYKVKELVCNKQQQLFFSPLYPQNRVSPPIRVRQGQYCLQETSFICLRLRHDIGGTKK